MHQNQTNDFDLGIHPYPDGIFWTVRMPDHVAEADVDDGTASYRVKGLKTPDYGSLPSALAGGPSVPARSSFDVEWRGPSELEHERLHLQRYADAGNNQLVGQ